VLVSEEERRRRVAQCYKLILACGQAAEKREATGDSLDGDQPVAHGLATEGEQQELCYHDE
jgi:hypothetical protein